MNLLSLWLALVVAMAPQIASAQVSTQQTDIEVNSSAQIDPRIEKLDEFFGSYNCPEPYRSMTYIEVADKYGIPYNLLPALSLKESTCGKKVFRKNNWWGFGIKQFDSVEQGIEYVSATLSGSGTPDAKYYKNKTLTQKLKTYNSVNKNYPSHAVQLMSSIDN